MSAPKDTRAAGLLAAAEEARRLYRLMKPVADGPHDEDGLVAVGATGAYLEIAAWCVAQAQARKRRKA